MNGFPGRGTTREAASAGASRAVPKQSRLMVVRCGSYHLGIAAGPVLGVVGAGEIVPLNVDGLQGLVWRDGALLPVVRLGPLLGLDQPEGPIVGHGVLVRSENGSLCFLVDEALHLVDVPSVSVMPLPYLVRSAVPSSVTEAVASLERLVPIVDPLRLLGRERAAMLLATAAAVATSGHSTLSLG